MKNETEKMKLRRIFHWVFLSGIWLFTFVFAELALRIMVPPPYVKSGKSLFRNFAARPAGGLGLFDPKLGWMPLPNQEGHDAHGFRMNQNQVDYESSGRVLTIGDSFTYGAELPASQSYSAFLEKKLKLRVFNGGVGGYGLAQMLVQLEKHIDRVDPETVVVAPISDDLYRTGLAIRHGVNQPYYKLDENGELLLVEATDYRKSDARSFFQKTGGYSYILHLLMMTVARDYWIQGTQYEFRNAKIDLVQTSRRIIDRIKTEVVDRRGKNLIFVFLPESASEIRMTDPDPDYLEFYEIADYMIEVAGKDKKIAFIDLQDILQDAIPEPEERRKLFFEVSATSAGHFNEKGTEWVADQIVRYLDRDGKLIPGVSPIQYDFD